MTNQEADRFVNEIIRGYWPRWKPNDEEIRGWISRLILFDYEKARNTVGNLLFQLNLRGIEPPAGKIMTNLRTHAMEFIPPTDEFIKDPNKLYGKAARDEAYAIILNGPDTPGRRWLVKYLKKIYPNKEDAVQITEAIEF